MKILVAIANYGSKNLQYLQRLLQEYRSMSFDVNLVVLSNVPKDLGTDVEVIVGLPTKDPWSLPFGHKELFAKRVDAYDLFIYSEDDTLITERNVRAFLDVTEILPKEKIAGFLRFEVAPDGIKYYSSVHAHYHWDPNSVLKSGEYFFARYTNDHSGCYILTKKQLQAAITSGGFLQGPREGRYDLLVTAATDPYTVCGMQKLICISHLRNFTLHHLPDKYCGAPGVEASAVEKEIQALIRLSESDVPRRQLLRTETKLSRSHWDKRYYGPARKDVLRLVPKSARTVLSVGCGAGLTEAELIKAGIHVTGVPLDDIIAVSARSRGIDVTPPDFELARQHLKGRRFDLIFFSDILHLLPDPAVQIKAFLPSLSASGAVLVSIPNFNHVWVLRRMFSGDRELRELKKLNDFERFGVHFTTLGILKKWLARCGLVKSSVCTDVAPHRRRLSQMTLNAFDRFLTGNIVVLARRRIDTHVMREKQMKAQSKAILKKVYYKSIPLIQKMFVPKTYRFELEFFENMHAETYSDIFYKQSKLRSLTHQLDKILTFKTIKNMDLMVNNIIKLSKEVMSDPDHDPAIINWCNNVVKEYNSRKVENIAINTGKINFDQKEFELMKKIIATRRSIRSFKAENISKDILYEILAAGLWAPSGCNRQTIEYLLLDNKDDIRYCQRIAGEGYSFPQEASLSIVVLVDPRNYALPNQRHMAYLEGGAAIQNILLMAHSLNVGSCWLFWNGNKASSHREFIHKFNLRPWLLPVSMVCLGYADTSPQYCPVRKDLSKSIHN